MTTLTDHSKTIPEIWKHKIDEKGRIYVSQKTISETDYVTLQRFLNDNNYTLEVFNGGAWIKVNVI